MSNGEWLAERFEEHRPRLRAIAYRILGSASDADDAVQEAWIRFSRADASSVHDLGSWLTTVVSRVCLNMLQARRSRPQPTAGPDLREPVADRDESDPEYQALLAESVGLALMVVLDKLAPAERVAFVLHDVFAIPFDQIAPIVGRSTPATRQLASRARARVRQHEGRRRPTGCARRRSSTPSSPPPGRATSTGCSRCSTPTWCSVPTTMPSRWAQRRRRAAGSSSPSSLGTSAAAGGRCSTARRRRSGCRAAGSASSGGSRRAETGSRA
jgi:RNA polymerase sigma factor (sigma-70 family)